MIDGEVDEIVSIATTPETTDVLAALIRAHRRLIELADADRIYAAMMRAHAALFSPASHALSRAA